MPEMLPNLDEHKYVTDSLMKPHFKLIVATSSPRLCALILNSITSLKTRQQNWESIWGIVSKLELTTKVSHNEFQG